MGDKLLIRAYNVGCGDCIYVRIPDAKDGFHILIDCGKKGGTDLLKQAVEHMEEHLLPASDTPGKKRLDLIVATHRHEDHIKGFDPAWFKQIDVKNVWLSQALDPNHPQSEKSNALHAFATRAMRRLADSGQALSPQAELLTALYGVSNDVADDFLMKKIPDDNQITPKFVHSGMTGKELGLKLPKGAAITVLAPENDIDHYYFGDDADATLKGLNGLTAAMDRAPSGTSSVTPTNISASDFRVLKSRMLSNTLSFAGKDSSIQNNMSVVLLIEWKKRRLLFVGDAEWEGEFRDGKHNGSWNVMWEMHRKKLLKSPLDFLKIGHHGSINATPPPAEKKPPGQKPTANGVTIYQVLDALLPVPKAGQQPTAKAIVSTEREFYAPIPQCDLLVNIARRVCNTRNYGKELKSKRIDPKSLWATDKARKYNYFEAYEKEFLDSPQPVRTDLEFAITGQPYIDVEFEPN